LASGLASVPLKSVRAGLGLVHYHQNDLHAMHEVSPEPMLFPWFMK
jgi:hypothetical protein